MLHNKNQVWVIDDDQAMRWVLERAFKKEQIAVTTFESANLALTALQHKTPAVIMTDVRMPGMDGLQFLKIVREKHPLLPIIIMTAYSDLSSAVGAYQGGAFEYLPKPFDVDDAVSLVKRACKEAVEKTDQPTMPPPSELAQEVIGESPAMQDVYRAIGRLSSSTITVLITGESGTGKEVIARALHRHSPRANGPFVALNMAAIPRELMESELFGHEKGAFTGAQVQRLGRFEQAHHGTLFLDEIGDMPVDLQTRLLRVLADGVFYRVGGSDTIKADVRIIAATNQNLEQRVAKGEFRDDLFHRLNVIRMHIPPLRERREDIPALLDYFMTKTARELSVEQKRISPEVANHLTKLEWPGNIRQLENVCRWLTVMASSQVVYIEDLPGELKEKSTAAVSFSDSWDTSLLQWAQQALERGETDLLAYALPKFEATIILAAMHKTGGRRHEAAKLLGWGRNTLTRKIQELGLFVEEEQNVS